MSAEQIEGQARQVDHQGCHEDVVGHGEDFTHHRHAVRLGEVYVFCKYTFRNQKSSREILRSLYDFGQEYQGQGEDNSAYISRIDSKLGFHISSRLAYLSASASTT